MVRATVRISQTSAFPGTATFCSSFAALLTQTEPSELRQDGWTEPDQKHWVKLQVRELVQWCVVWK